MMKNMLGEDVEPRKVTCKWNFPYLEVFIDGHWYGMVEPNGWRGYSMDIHHRLAEPVMNNVHLWSTMSLADMKLIISEYEANMPPERAMSVVIHQIAKEKKMSFADALAYVKRKNIPMLLTTALESVE